MHLEYFLLSSSLLDVFFREKLLQAGKKNTQQQMKLTNFSCYNINSSDRQIYFHDGLKEFIRLL